MSWDEAEYRSREEPIALVAEEDAEGRVAEIYRKILEEREDELEDDLRLSKLWMLYGSDPELLEAVWQHMNWMYKSGSIPTVFGSW